MLWHLYLNSDICIVSNHLHTVVGNLVSPGLSCLRLNPITYRVNLNNVLYHNILENILEFVHHVIVLGLPHTHASQCVL